MADSTPPEPAPLIDFTVPHSARIWNYWLGGKDHHPADRDAGDAYAKIFPRITEIARASRCFLARVVGYLAADAGIRQFLDIGTGLPTVMGIMGHIGDLHAYPITRHLVAALPPSSYLALYDGSNVNPAFNHAQDGYNQSGAAPYHLRTPKQIARFFTGLDLVEPGIVPCSLWRPEPSRFGPPAEVEIFGGLARKP